jgi:hypothetical protein
MRYFRSDEYLIKQKKETIKFVTKWSTMILFLIVLFPTLLMYTRERSLAATLGCDLNQEKLTMTCSAVNDNINRGSFMTLMFFLMLSLFMVNYLDFLKLEILSHISTLESYEAAKQQEMEVK